MKNSKNKGFVLVETIIISVVITTALLVIYIQLITINNNFNKHFTYDNVDKLYLTEEIVKFLANEDTSDLEKDSKPYVNITKCDSNYITNYAYCETLFNTLGIKTVLFTENNISQLKVDLNTYDFSEKLKEYINIMNIDNTSGYRVIVEYNDDTYTSLKIR